MSKKRMSMQQRRVHNAGFSLIELMVAMVLGLIVIAGAVSVFMAGDKTYISNEALSNVQTNARVAFELMARDIRGAGLTGCNNNGRVANVLKDSSTDWYAEFSNAVHGYDSSQPDPALPTQRVAGTDSLQLIGAEGSGLSVAKTPSGYAANFRMSEKTTSIESGDIVIVCDPDHAAIVQVTVQNKTNVELVHDQGSKTTPGNCSDALGYPTSCSASGNGYTYKRGAQIAQLSAVDWYIGTNSEGGKSLYRVALVNKAGVPTPTAQEMVRDVTDLQLTYHISGATGFVDATKVSSANWANVDAVRMTLTLESNNKHASADTTQAISRKFTATTTIRNRVK